MRAPAAGPAAATSKRSVRFLTRLFNCVMAPKHPTWAFGSNIGAPSFICTTYRNSTCGVCGSVSQKLYALAQKMRLIGMASVDQDTVV
jgi:hypothetical protein